jgi:beta-N-acetylhexosaminidase
MKGWTQKTFAGMTLEQKLGQLMVSFLDDEGDIRGLARAGALGGLYSVAGRTVREAAEWVAGMQQEAATPLLLCADFETGSTFAGGTTLPSPMAIAATDDPELARAAGRVTAREIGAIGFRFMGSPVVDINRPDNPIVSTRAFGEEPDAVTRMALAYAEGVQGEGVIACLKHFPGTGDIDTDTWCCRRCRSIGSAWTAWSWFPIGPASAPACGPS